MKKILLLLTLPIIGLAQNKPVKFISNENEKKIEVLVDNKPFTAYFYPGKDVLKKAVLYPVRTAQGTLVTRGWPLDPRPGERIDHPHHVGIWLNYESVNGHDFWNNSVEVEKAGDPRTFGTIVHTGIKKMKGGKKTGTLEVTADWLDKNGKTMLNENTTFRFSGTTNQRIIDRETTLTATDETVVFKDVKDGFYAIRVARELELPSNKPEIFTDAAGLATAVPKLDNTGITGNYLNAQGIEGENTWGKRSEWVNLHGKIGNEAISIAIIDHPKNVGYPSYWHTRGYGLFSVNTLGQKALSGGKDELNLTLQPHESVTFRYRMVITSGEITSQELDKLAADFAK